MTGDDVVKNRSSEVEEIEIKEWLSSLDYVLTHGTEEQAKKILQQLQIRAQEAGVTLPFVANTPYINTIPPEKQPPFPGIRDTEGRIKSITR